MSLRTGLTRLFVERRLPWRVEQWLSSLAPVQAFRLRRLEQWDRSLYRPFVRRGDLVFDIGANRGDKSAIFLECGGRVIAVEPDAAVASELRERFAGHPAFRVVEAGVGAEAGRRAFHQSSYSTRSTFAVDRMLRLGDGVDYGTGVLVEMTTLDGLIERYGVPSFCKIDVEGYEPEVFRGLSQPLPALSFEFHGDLLDDARTCVKKLADLRMTRFNMVLHPIADHQHQTLDHLYLPAHTTPDRLFELIDSIATRYRLAGDIWAFSD